MRHPQGRRERDLARTPAAAVRRECAHLRAVLREKRARCVRWRGEARRWQRAFLERHRLLLEMHGAALAAQQHCISVLRVVQRAQSAFRGIALRQRDAIAELRGAVRALA